MSEYILCQTKRAATPYYIENISLNIYSIEELCYYLYNNLYLIDDTIMNEGLCSWIETELQLPNLALKLRRYIGRSAGLEDFLYPVFKEINYLTYDELKDLNNRLSLMREEPEAQRRKAKSDSMIENGMYVNAIRDYQKLCSEIEEQNRRSVEAGTGPGKDAALLPGLYHNLGCAYAHLFQMENALEGFYKAWDLDRKENRLITYLLAFREVRTPLEYESRLSELSVNSTVRMEIKEKLEQFSRKPQREVYSQHVDEIIREITSEYHRSTGS